MRQAWLLAIALFLVSAGNVGAGSIDHPDWFEKAKDFARSLIGVRVTDQEVIEAPVNIDRQMVIVPREPRATMRVIPPPDSRR